MRHLDLLEVNINFEKERKRKKTCPITNSNIVKSLLNQSAFPFSIPSNLKYWNILVLMKNHLLDKFNVMLESIL